MENKATYEWNEAKCEANIAKHGIDFSIIHACDWSTAKFQKQIIKGETRWLALTMIANRLHGVVFTIRADKIRIISIRKANSREVRYYEKAN